MISFLLDQLVILRQHTMEQQFQIAAPTAQCGTDTSQLRIEFVLVSVAIVLPR